MRERISVFFEKTGYFLFCILVFLTPFLTPSPLIRFGKSFYRLRYGEVYLILIFFIFLFLIFKFFLTFNFKNFLKNEFKERQLFFLIFAFFIGVNFLSLFRFLPFLEGASYKNLLNMRTEFGYSMVRFFSLITGFFLTFLTAKILSGFSKIKQILKVYILAGDLACFFGYYIFIRHLFKLGYHPVQKYVARSWILPRFIGTALEPQTFANFLLSVIFLSMVLYFFEKKLIPRIFYFFSFIFQFITLFLTFSIGGLVSFLIGFLVLTIFLIFLKEKIIHKKFLIILFFVFLAFLVSLVNPFFRDALGILLKKSKPVEDFLNWKVKAVRASPFAYTAFDRYVSRQVALKMFFLRPVLGWGTGSFGYRYHDFKIQNKFLKEYFRPRTHQQYLEILAESGLAGFLSFLSMVILLFRILIKKMKKLEDEKKVLVIGEVATLSAFLIHGFSYGFFPHFYFWFFVGLIVASEI